MLDINFIPGQQDNVKIFYASGTTAWQTWQKPRNCKFIWMMCIGAGNGGGGGNGGGSGGVVRALFPANVLPDTLFVQPGSGTGPTIFPANRSFVSITPSSTVVMNLVCVSGAAAAGTGGPPGAETIATVTNAGLLSLGNFIAIAGTGATAPLSTTITMGGANCGSFLTPAASYASINLGTTVTPPLNSGDNTTGGNGNHGFWSWKPMFGTGGMAGGYNEAGRGGNGGNGAYGCGGGGSGNGTGGFGVDGSGGDGLVIISTF